MSLTSKLLMSTIAAGLIAQAADFNLERFVKTKLVRNPQITVQKVELLGKKPVGPDGKWQAYMFMMDLKMGGKKTKIPDIIFVNDQENLATMSLIDLKSGEDLSRRMKPAMPESYYDDAHLISGHKNAKHKMVVFSDPQCPFCIRFIPGMYREAKAHPDQLAVYYYHMPLLRLHPVSETLTRVMEHLQKQGRIDEAMKIYGLKIDPRTTDENKILSALKQQLGIDVKPEEIDKKEIKAAVKSDMDRAARMMVRGTPTVYFDGKYDADRNQYKKYLK